MARWLLRCLVHAPALTAARVLHRVLQVACIYEPTVTATIITPAQHCGAVMKLAAARRGSQLEYNFLGGSSKAASSSSSNVASEVQQQQPQQAAAGDVLAAAAAAADTGTAQPPAGPGAGAGADASAGGASELLTDRVLLRYQLPLSELAGDFYSKLKSATQG